MYALSWNILHTLDSTFQQRELQIRRQFHEAMKVQQKQYKMYKEQVIDSLNHLSVSIACNDLLLNT